MGRAFNGTMEGVKPIILKTHYQIKNALRVCQVRSLRNYDPSLKRILSFRGRIKTLESDLRVRGANQKSEWV